MIHGYLMRRRHRDPYVLPRENRVQTIALLVLLMVTGLAIFGPSGLLAWGENTRLLEERQARIAALREERDAQAIRVDALDPDRADPDMVGELLRQKLDVLPPDEIMLSIEPDGR